MAGKKLEYQIGVDSSQGITGVKKFSDSVKRELKSTEDDVRRDRHRRGEGGPGAVRDGRDLDTELDRAAAAAEALSQAFGPELTGEGRRGAAGR